MRNLDLIMQTLTRFRDELGLKFEIKLDSVEQPTWIFSNDFTPIVLLSRDFIESVFLRYNFRTIKKLFCDPFLGIFPHEYNEAILTLRIAQGDYDDVVEEFPSFKNTRLSNFYSKKVSETTPLSNGELHTLIGPSLGEFEWIGGLAHDILVSQNEKLYHSWLAKTEL